MKVGIPDLEHSKTVILRSPGSPDPRPGDQHAIDEFVAWYCSEPQLSESTWGSRSFCRNNQRTFGYRDVKKGVAWDGTLLLKELEIPWFLHRALARRVPQQARARAGVHPSVGLQPRRPARVPEPLRRSARPAGRLPEAGHQCQDSCQPQWSSGSTAPKRRMAMAMTVGELIEAWKDLDLKTPICISVSVPTR
jgi:hypothetical protein